MFQETQPLVLSNRHTYALVELLKTSIANTNTRRAYVKSLEEFLAWMGDRPFNRQTIKEWRAEMADKHSPSYVNQRLSAIRKLVTLLDDTDDIDPRLAVQITSVKGVPMRGVRVGRWLTREEATALLLAPDTNTVRGLRDHAILAVMLGAGLRRSEVTTLRPTQFTEVEGRYVIANIEGKGNRVRTVPVAPWVREAVFDWLLYCAGITDDAEHVFKSIAPNNKLNGSIDPQTIHDVVVRYAKVINISATPHDLRRTFARRALQNGAPIEQIQYSLGHASVQTTERYLSINQDFTNAPSDYLDFQPY